MSIKSSYLVVVVAVGSAFMLGGCGVDSAGDEVGSDEAASLATTKQATISGWTVYTTTASGSGPVGCDNTSLVNGVECSGDYCDKMKLFCQATLFGVRGASYWTTTFSDENSNPTYCADGYWVTGLQCSGQHCDYLSLQCSYMSNLTARECTWTGAYSEENGQVYFPVPSSAYYLRGAKCSGHYCDNVDYYICRL